MAYAPANDPFVITVGALDLHNSTNPDRADLAPWSAWATRSMASPSPS